VGASSGPAILIPELANLCVRFGNIEMDVNIFGRVSSLYRGKLSVCRQRLRGRAVTGEDRGYAPGIGATEPALGGDTEVLDHTLGGPDSRAVAFLVIELQEAQVQVAALRPPHRRSGVKNSSVACFGTGI
jgi:hypothetical protein